MDDRPDSPRRILVVEDGPIVAMDLQDILQDLGWEVVGPTGNLAHAIEFATGEPLDAAVIDINIRGGKVYPVARALAARDIPFLLASGYADRRLPPDLADRPCVEKPYNKTLIEQRLEEMMLEQAAK